MRLFTALDLPSEVMRNLEDLLDRLRPAIPANPRKRDPVRIVWRPASNLHITTKFIGSWPEERLAELKTALAGLPGRAAIPVRIRGLVFFPNPHGPRALTCGVEAPGLETLAKDTEAAATALGIDAEDR